MRAVQFFGGVAEVWVPDQLRSAVSTPHRYDPETNRTYGELATHYGAVGIPARPRKPKDKAEVEVGGAGGAALGVGAQRDLLQPG